MRNPYTVLGVQKNADEKAIKSAFRKLAKKYHPDQNPDDKSAQKKFAEVNQAYEIVGDKEKRAQYDRGEIDETGKPKFAGFGGGNPFGEGSPFGRGGQQRGQGNPFGGAGGFGGAEDILNDIFGSAFGGNARGGQQNPFSGASGFGAGRASGTRTSAPSLDLEIKASVSLEDLMRGKTNVRMPDGKQISVSVPAEADDGQVVRLKGKGKSAAGRKPGDALVTLVMRTHGRFQRQGTDLRTEVEVPLETAVLGGKVPVATMDGKLSLTIPAATSSGKLFRLKGKGLPKKDGGYGDLLVGTLIKLPEEGLEKLADFLASNG